MTRIIALWRTVAGLDLRLLWFAIRHESRPGWLLPAVALLALFVVEPMNFAVPLLGAVDELVLLPILLHGMAKLLPASILESFARAHPGRQPGRTM